MITDEIITSNFSSEWKIFISEKVFNWLNLFNRKLCYEEKTNTLFLNSIDGKNEENNNDQNINFNNNSDLTNEDKNNTNVK